MLCVTCSVVCVCVCVLLVYQVSPTKATRLGHPAFGHLADGLGLQHCVTGSLEATEAFDKDHSKR